MNEIIDWTNIANSISIKMIIKGTLSKRGNILSEVQKFQFFFFFLSIFLLNSAMQILLAVLIRTNHL